MLVAQDPFRLIQLSDDETLEVHVAAGQLRHDHGRHAPAVADELLRRARAAYRSVPAPTLPAAKRVRALGMLTAWLSSDMPAGKLLPEAAPAGPGDAPMLRAHILAAVVRAVVEAKQAGRDPGPIVAELKRLASSEGLAELRHALGQVKRLGLSVEGVAWLAWERGTSAGGRTRWRNQQTGELRYQEAEPGTRRAGDAATATQSSPRFGDRMAKGNSIWDRLGQQSPRAEQGRLFEEMPTKPKPVAAPQAAAQQPAPAQAPPAPVSDRQAAANVASLADAIANMEPAELQAAQQKIADWTVNGQRLHPNVIEQVRSYVEAKVDHASGTPANAATLKHPAFVRRLADDLNRTINKGIVKEGVLDRTDDSTKFPYTNVAGLNLHLRGKTDPTADLATAQQQANDLAAQVDALPTQTNRTGKKDEFQQFSTPPHYAFAAAWVANLKPGEVVLEPSAGTGCLAIQAENAGAKVYANELDPERADYLRHLFGDDRVHVENAEQISGILPGRGVPAPSVVVMNPPFSATAGRMGDKKELLTGAKHIQEAAMMLAPGGRLVSIVGRGMTPESPTYKAWFRDMAERGFTLRANVGVGGEEYKKYGTNFGTRVLVFDRTPNDGKQPVTGDADGVADLMSKLEGVRNDRLQPDEAAQPASSEPTGGAAPASAAPSGQPASALPSATRNAPSGADRADGAGGASVPAVESGRGDSGEPIAGRPGAVPAGNGTIEPAGAGVAGASGSASAKPSRAARRDRGGQAAGGQPGGQPGASVPKLRAAAPISIESIEPKQIAAKASDQKAADDLERDEDALFEIYEPARLKIPGAKPHPSALVESSAMAAVPPPAPTYRPHLSPDVVEKGMLTAPALEAVVYAGQAHEQFLPAAEGEQPMRRGYFIGDGTGAGKGREISGVIADNWNQGRKRHVWVSEKQTLFEDATRDWKDIGQDPKDLFHFDKLRKAAPPVEGVCFVTYDTLKGRPKDPAKASNLDELAKWLGPDFDGIIAFDEAHGMRNAKATEGERGMTKPSQKALAGLNLQKMLPKARILYVSATGATEVSNLAYAERLGLWGRGTAFTDKGEFIDQMNKGGVAAMECVAQNLKAMGAYVARALSYDDGTPDGRVTYSRLTHKLSDEQRQQYDALATGWQNVLKNIDKALEAGAPRDNKGNVKISSQAKSAALSQFWGAQRAATILQPTHDLDSDAERHQRDGAGHQGRTVTGRATGEHDGIGDEASDRPEGRRRGA
jgi:predicted RNA methylase